MPDNDAIGDLLAEASGAEVVQNLAGRAVTWGVQVLDPTAALEVPEILDRLLVMARSVLAEASAHENPAIAEALAAARARDAKGRSGAAAEPDAADVMRRLQRIAMRAVVSIEVDGERQRCRLVDTREQQTPSADASAVLGEGGERLIWVGILDRGALQSIYLAAAVRIQEAAARLARFPGRAGTGGNARSDGASIQPAPERVSIAAAR